MDSVTGTLRADYDAVKYPSQPFRHAHPERIATAAALAGRRPPSLERGRVLEIGCATGGNLIPMAEEMPAMEFLGIDLSQQQVNRGQEIIRELGLDNIELRCQDLIEFPADAGTFDYIIAHGFYSWVPPSVRCRLMEICQRHLSKTGLAYISYGTFPGCHSMLVAREMMMYHARNATDDRERVRLGTEIIEFVRENALVTGEYPVILEKTRKMLKETRWEHVRHDTIAAVNDPVYFMQFMAEASRFGLAYVGDSDKYGVHGHVSEPSQKFLNSMSLNPVEWEQYFDFLVNRSFRSSVLCLSESVPELKFDRESLKRAIWVSGSPTEKPDGVDASGAARFELTYVNARVTLTEGPILAAFRQIRSCWPASVRFSDLAEIARKNCMAHQNVAGVENALLGFLEMSHGLKLIELSVFAASNIAGSMPKFPKTTRFARWQAEHHIPLTSLRHTIVNVEDSIIELLKLLDGSRSVNALAEEVVKAKKRDPESALPPDVTNIERGRVFAQSVLGGLLNKSLLLNE